MQQIHLNDVTLICPYVGVMGVGVRCSLSETGLEQAKKTQPVNGNGHFLKKYGSAPPPPPQPITWFQTQLILTTCQIRYHSHCGIIVALDSSDP